MRVDTDTTVVLRDVIAQVVKDMHSSDIREAYNELPEHTEEAAGAFCDRFELGEWFYEAMVIDELDIAEILSDIIAEREREEHEAAEDRAEIDRDYRISQGWPY